LFSWYNGNWMGVIFHQKSIFKLTQLDSWYMYLHKISGIYCLITYIIHIKNYKVLHYFFNLWLNTLLRDYKYLILILIIMINDSRLCAWYTLFSLWN
jgi:hypothetical protein